MYQQTGSCPHCGAPIYCESPWMSILPPPPIYTCNCTAGSRQIKTTTGTDSSGINPQEFTTKIN